MIVVDASAILEILRQTPIGLQFEQSLKGMDLHAPYLIDLEVAQVLRRWELNGETTPSGAFQALQSFQRIPIVHHSHRDLIPEIWKLRHNLTAYDASYLALARLLDAELLTVDSALRKLSKRR